MTKHIKKLISFLFCLLLLGQVFAAPQPSIEKTIQDFLSQEGLDDSNFAMSYYNPVTGDSYAFHAEAFLPVGKLRFLPTQMYFYEEETKGTFEPEAPDDPEFTIDGMTLEECRYHSILLSEDSVSEKMQAAIGTDMQYLELINQRYGMLNPDTLPTEYWTGKVLSIEFLMNCVRTLSTRPELFKGLMSNYAMVQKADAFVDDAVSYPIVQIRGEADGYVTAIAEVSAPQNFLLVASVKVSSGGDEILGKLNKTICNYIQGSVGETVAEETQVTTQRDNSKYYIGEERLAKDNTLSRWLFLSFGIAAGIALIGAVIWLIWRSNHRQY